MVVCVVFQVLPIKVHTLMTLLIKNRLQSEIVIFNMVILIYYYIQYYFIENNWMFWKKNETYP